MSTDYIDELERELRAASRRHVRLAMARVPRAPAGTAAFVLTLAICAAVAVPLLQARSRSTSGPATAQPHPQRPGVVRTCADTVSGQLAVGWHKQRHGTVIAGPVTWPYLLGSANRAAIDKSHFVEGLAVVQPGRAVTVSIPLYERHRLALDYTSVAPRKRFYLGQGVSSVTFKPCGGAPGETQFDGGFIVKGPQCAAVFIQPVGDKGIIERFLPFGRSCRAENHPPAPRRVERVLQGNGIGAAKFGGSPKTVVRQLTALLHRPPTDSKSYYPLRAPCQVDHEDDWPGLSVYFSHGHFVGYSYDQRAMRTSEPILATAKGLSLGETLKQGRRNYGAKFQVSRYQGGKWSVSTAHGRMDGYTSEGTNLNGDIITIAAGDLGCPVATP